MCGIVAAFSYGSTAPPVSAEEILRARDAMYRRGPDAAAHWISTDQRVALAHRRLSIIDLSPNGAQPMVVEETQTRITFNGEIYNYQELGQELRQRGHVFRTTSDTEVLLHAYDEFGPQMLNRLRGMYAFAIWDERRGGMFLARDPFGIKPLYYADDGKQILVASQVKALSTIERISKMPSAAGQVSFLLWGFIVEPHTLLRDIHALPAGTSMWIDRRGAQSPTKFWSVAQVFREAQSRRAEMDRNGFDARAVSEVLRDALSSTIKYHMVSDVPVGIFLSGGLDSTTMVALASEQGLGDLKSLTLGFEDLRGTEADEVEDAELVASAYHTRHETHWIGSENFAKERTRLLEAMDQPSIDGVNVYFVSQMAAAAGLKVALSGLGGDELFGSYPSFQQIPRLLRFMRRFSSVGPNFGRTFRQLSAPILRQLTSPKYASLFEYGTSLEDAYLLRRGLFLPWELPELVGPETLRQGWGELAPLAHLRECTRNIQDLHAGITTLEMTIYMRNQLLRDSDWAGMAHSLEIRLPFVDAMLFRELAPFLLGQHPIGKTDMTKVLRTPLPESILNRPKTGFAVPIRDWLLKDAHGRTEKNERGLRGWAKFILRDQLMNATGQTEIPE